MVLPSSSILGPNSFGQEFQIDLVTDAGTGRHHGEIIKGTLAPLQKGIPFAIALEFFFDIFVQGAYSAGLVHHDRVIDDQITGGQRIDLLRITTHFGHGVAHGSQIDHGRDASEILHQHAGGSIGNFMG